MAKKRKRRTKGGGAIYQRSDGYWCGSVDRGVGPDGKRRRKVVYATTMAAVRRKMDAVLACYVPDGDAGTVNEYLDSYLARRKPPALKRTTFERYVSSFRNHVRPYLGTRQLAELQPIDIQKWYDKMTAAGVSADAQRKAAVVFGTALKRAVALKAIGSNPVGDIAKPTVRKAETEILTDDQAKKLVADSVPNHFHALVVTALTTGARQGELFGLGWDDIDLDAGTIRINKALTEVRGKLQIERPKTKASVRTITIPAGTVNTLLEHRDWMKLGGTHRDDCVFPAPRGGRVRKSNFRQRYWLPLLAELKMPAITFRSLRHFHCSTLLKRGEPIKSVQKRLGHADVQTTLNIYAKVMGDDDRSASDKMEDLF